MAIPVEREPPLVVDLDGTLIRSDLLLESLVVMLRRAPWLALMVPVWLLQGKPALKRELARRATVAPEGLPYRPEVVSLVEAAQREARQVVLATASNGTLVQPVAEHLGIWDVMASGDAHNLKGEAKRAALVERFGERGFDYVGDSMADVAVWKSSRRAYVAGGPAVLAAARAANADVQPVQAEARKRSGWKRALRIHQWPKNLLVFVPLLTAHAWADPDALLRSLFAFAGFCFVASAIYVTNDLVDLPSDRQHDTKRHRPFASGDIGIAAGLVAIPLLLAAGWTLAFAASQGFALALAAYTAIAIAYSLRLKQLMVVDVLVIAGLYTLRIVGGALAIDVALSQWLLAFSMFLFLSLALVKRHGELAKLLARRKEDGELARRFTRRKDDDDVPGRGYRPSDAPLVAQLGTSSGYLAVLVLALYLNSEVVSELYRRPLWLWALPVLMLYWITRAWLLAYRGTLAEDPLSFALRDPPSYFVAGLMVACVLIAT